MKAVVACALAALWCGLVARADAGAIAERDYDVRDLLVQIPDFDDAPALGVLSAALSPTTEPAHPTETRAGAEADFLKRIAPLLGESARATLPPRTGILHVAASNEDQQRLAAALDRAHASRRMQVTIECRFLTLDPKEIASAGPDIRKLFDDVALSGSHVLLDERQLSSLLEKAAALKTAELVSAPRITLFRGQRAYALVSTQRSYVAAYAAQLPGDAKHELSPVINIVASGVVLDVRADCADDGSSFSIALRPQLCKLLDMTRRPWPNVPGGKKLEIEVPRVQTQSLDELVSIPADRSMMIAMPTDATTAGSKQTVVIVKPKLLRD